MSTAPAPAPDAVSATPGTAPPSPSYWQLPATKWDAAKFALPLIVAVIWAGVSLWFSDQAQGQELLQHRATLSSFREAKEDRGGRMLVLENEVRGLREDVREMRGDIKLLLRKAPP